MASVRENGSHNPELYKDQPLKRPIVKRDVGARCVASCEDMELPSQASSLASSSSLPSALRYHKLPLWLTAKEQLQVLEEKVKQLAAKNSKMIASIVGKQISKECLSSLTTKRSSKIENISSRDVGAVEMEDQDLRNEKIKIQIQKEELTEMESSLEVKKEELFHLRETNARLAREIRETKAAIANLKETQAIRQMELDDISGKRLEIRCHNSKLRKKNTRMLAEQRKHTYDQIQIMEELELQERELRAALRTNQNLRREAKRKEGKVIRFRRWVQRKLARLPRIRSM